MDARHLPLDTLRKAFQIEVDGYTFYSMAADKARTAAVRDMFAKLAVDEQQHQIFLKDIIRFYDVKGAAAFAVPLRSAEMLQLAGAVLPDRLGLLAQDAEFEGAVLSIGMQLETNAIACYSEVAEQALEAEVRGFYRFLTDWETQHLNALRRLHAALRPESGEHSA
jgi:rubrerythrin